MTHMDLTLVLGGNGKTGRRVAHRLRPLDRPVRCLPVAATEWRSR